MLRGESERAKNQGLVNQGAMCCFNSLVQALYFTPEVCTHQNFPCFCRPTTMAGFVRGRHFLIQADFQILWNAVHSRFRLPP